MKQGLYGQQLTLMEELKATTYLPHVHLQEAPFFEALAACQLPLESYVGQLRALSIIHGVLDQALESTHNETVVSVWRSNMRKLPLLQKDLRYFEPRVVADIKESVEATLTIAEHIRLQSLEMPVMLLGHVYVLEGSTLGARVLRPLFARAFLLTGEDGLNYLNSYGPEAQTQWAQYQQRMNALRLSPDERQRMLQAACEFFSQLKAVFETLYPFKPESKTFLVTSINPEAGRHPVPSDVREVNASIQAADACWQRFPYFEARYGERGRRFARSDGAWLTTLCQFDQEQISQQVSWLGRILSTRGMPTVMLQVQLEILFEELANAIPEKRPEYEKLLVAAAELHKSRSRYIEEDQFQGINEAFNRAVGPEWSKRFEHSGALLVSAVADEQTGSVGAVENIETWMTNSARFPAVWITAMQEILAKARELISRCANSTSQDL
jgi:heme oxygenase